MHILIIFVAAISPTLAVVAIEAAEGGVKLSFGQFFGIPIALVGAVLLAIGTQYQSRGLNKVEKITQRSASHGLSLTHMLHLIARPSWLLGTLGIVAAVLFQIISLSMAPLIVVQPLGVVALVVTALLNSKLTGVKITGPVKVAIALCIIGIVAFVSVAAFTASESEVSNNQLVIILIIFAAIVGSLLTAFFTRRGRKPAILMYVVGAGVLYGFVATFAKTILARIQGGNFDYLTWLAIAALVVGVVLGMIYVQNAHSSGPPDLVIAGLTVVDPIVAVLIGILVLGEARNAPFWAFIFFVVSGVIAMLGVFGLAKFHPQSGKDVLADDDPAGPVGSYGQAGPAAHAGQAGAANQANPAGYAGSAAPNPANPQPDQARPNS
ncbi:MAG: DMT family transporter [Microbacteriaceae bacterium]|nr:DMT family transporter [Microbacteriaceae bacterium]